MTRHLITILTIGLIACGGSQTGTSTATTETGGANPVDGDVPAEAGDAEAGDESTAAPTPRPAPSDAGEFKVNTADQSTRPKQGTLKATKTEAAVRFFVTDKEGGPIEGIVISLTSPTGKKYYTKETDADGFAEVLAPIGQTYEVIYVSLGRRDGVAAKVAVANEPNLNLKLTMRYNRIDYPTGGGAAAPDAPEPAFVLDGVEFESGSAKLTPASHAQLAGVVEYMTHKTSARIEISGHTDNVGSKKANKKLSQKRADAVRTYLVSQGIDAGRITAVGYGDEKPIASNDTDAGRQKNRRIAATEL